MKQFSRNLPDGMRDLIFDEALLYETVEDTLSNIYLQNGFRRIETPVAEYFDVFDYEGQSIRQENMYKFTDLGGRLAVLRADNTTPIARIAATKLQRHSLPLKVYYDQNAYRINSGYSGKRNEIRQSGVEIIGADGVRCELLCLVTALEALKSLGLSFKLELGHVGFYNALAAELDLSEEQSKALRLYVDSKNTASMERLKEGEGLDKILRLPFLFGGEEVFDEATALAEGNEGAMEALSYVKTLYQLLVSAGYGEFVTVDLGVVHEIDYYTGVVFRGYVEGAGEAVLSGGRYNNLIRNFGCDLPATGFAIQVGPTAEAYAAKFGMPSYSQPQAVIFYEPARFAEAEQLRRQKLEVGVRCELSPCQSREETVKWARSAGVDEVICLDGAEIEVIRTEGEEQ